MLNNLELPIGNERLALPAEKPKLLKQPLYIENDTVKNLYFFMDTFLRRRLNEPETDALSLLNTMLTETLYSRILVTARERGLVYSMSSGIGQTRYSSNWWFGAQIMPKNVEALFDIISTELDAIFKASILEADIAAAKQYALGRFQRGAQTVQGTAGGYSWHYFFADEIDDYYKVPERIEAINKDAIVKVAQSLFKDNIWGLGVLGDCGESLAKKLHDQIAPLWS
jgi:predicted Zn-dependent peptidase